MAERAVALGWTPVVLGTHVEGDAATVGCVCPGGPDQVVAVAFECRTSEDLEAAVVFLDSDGSDGGTAHAGGVADSLSRRRAEQAGVHLRRALTSHASSALEALGDAVTFGPTGTNISDMCWSTQPTGKKSTKSRCWGMPPQALQ
jgi:glycerate 2-kinase